jgi:hypothetical protein
MTQQCVKKNKYIFVLFYHVYNKIISHFIRDLIRRLMGFNQGIYNKVNFSVHKMNLDENKGCAEDLNLP